MLLTMVENTIIIFGTEFMVKQSEFYAIYRRSGHQKNEWTNIVFNYICIKNPKYVNSAMWIYVCIASRVANLDIDIVVIHGSKFVAK